MTAVSAVPAVFGLAPSAGAAGCAGQHSCPYVEVSNLGPEPQGHGVFRFPQAIAFSPGGSYVFVADQFSALVQKFDRQGRWKAQIGGYASRAELGRLGVIGGLATDRAGHLYVLDSQNDRVQVFRSDDGTWLGAWGSHGAAPGYFDLGANTGAGGIAVRQASASEAPVAYVADQDNHRIQKFTLDQASSHDPANPVLPSGSRDANEPNDVPAPVPDKVWGVFGDCSARACSGAGDRYLLNHPQGLAVSPKADQAGDRHVYVADDDNHRVVEFTQDGTYVGEVGGYGTGPGQFRFPYDVGVDSSSFLYVADNNNHRVQKFSALDLSFLGSWGGFGSGPGNLEFTRALAALADDPTAPGGVYVADTANNRVQGFDPNGGLTAAWGVAGRGAGYVTRPGGVAVDAAGNVYVADTWDHRIEKFTEEGSYAGQLGYISSRSGYAAPASGDGQFRFPYGIAVDPSTGNFLVADTGNNRVQVLNAAGSWLATFGGPGAGSALGQFNGPHGIAADAAGNVYVADTMNDRIQKRDPVSAAWSSVPLGGQSLKQPAAVAVDEAGTLYVVDQEGLLRIAAGTANRLAPPGAGLDRPTGVSVHGPRVYVSDAGNSRVLQLDTLSGRWETIGGEGLEVGSFVGPAATATDPGGDALYVADQYNNRVQRFLLEVSRPPPPVTASTKPADTSAPRFRLLLRRSQRAVRGRAVFLTIECNEPCIVTAKGKIRVAGRKRRLVLSRASRKLAPRAKAKLKLRISRRDARVIRKALRRHKRVLAFLVVDVRDRTGNSRLERRSARIIL